MDTDLGIGQEFGLSEAQTAAILYTNPEWALALGLKNFESNEPMADFLRQKIIAALQKEQ